MRAAPPRAPVIRVAKDHVSVAGPGPTWIPAAASSRGSPITRLERPDKATALTPIGAVLGQGSQATHYRPLSRDLLVTAAHRAAECLDFRGSQAYPDTPSGLS